MPHAPPYKQSLVLSVDPSFRDHRYFCCIIHYPRSKSLKSSWILFWTNLRALNLNHWNSTKNPLSSGASCIFNVSFLPPPISSRSRSCSRSAKLFVRVTSRSLFLCLCCVSDCISRELHWSRSLILSSGGAPSRRRPRSEKFYLYKNQDGGDSEERNHKNSIQSINFTRRSPSLIRRLAIKSRCCGDWCGKKVLCTQTHTHTLSPALLFAVLQTLTKKKMMAMLLRKLWPSIWQSLSSSSLCLYGSVLLEQLSRLQALLPNSSGRSVHRGTCILVRKHEATH